MIKKIKINKKDLIEKDEISNGGNQINIKILNALNKTPDENPDNENEINLGHKSKIESEDFNMTKNEIINFSKHKDNYIKGEMMKKIIFRGFKQNIEKFHIPPELKKTYIFSLVLATLGITLIICGFIKAISDHTPGGGVMFWVLGSIVIIPGGFYMYQFYKAKHAKKNNERKLILDNIPQL